MSKHFGKKMSDEETEAVEPPHPVAKTPEDMKEKPGEDVNPEAFMEHSPESEDKLAWEGKPAAESKHFWNSITGSSQHKITACIRAMTGKVDDPGAFCASLAKKVGYNPNE